MKNYSYIRKIKCASQNSPNDLKYNKMYRNESKKNTSSGKSSDAF